MDTTKNIEAFLEDGGYSSIEDWAADSDYDLIDGGWVYDDPIRGACPVDLEECILGAMEACEWEFV